MTVRVPASQQSGTTREPQEPEQYPDRQTIRGTQPEGSVQRLVKVLAFLNLLNGQRLELEPSFGAADAPASRYSTRIAEGFNDRVS